MAETERKALPREAPHGAERDALTDVGPRLMGGALAVIGVINLARGDFTPIYHPMPDFLPDRAAVAVLCNLLLVGAALAVISSRFRRAGAGALAILLLSLSLGWIVRVIEFPRLIGTWLGLAEQLALVIGALAILAQEVRAPAWLAASCRGGFGLCELVFALGHFLSLPETVAMTPSYLPLGPRFWALATGALHLAGGFLLLVGIRPRLAARCLAAMFLTFGLLVWLPRLSESASPAAWAGNLINLALIGAVLTVGDASLVRLRTKPTTRWTAS